MLKIKISRYEQGIIQRFYIPVFEEDYGNVLICYFILIAPFMIIFVLIRNLWRCFWMDLFRINKMMEYKQNLLDINRKRK